MKKYFQLLLFAAILFAAPTLTHAQLSLPYIFGNGMVLQREHEIPIWGKAAPGDSVTVDLEGNIISAIADSLGKWQTALPAMEAGGPFVLKVTSGNQSITRNNVYIGDVWLASGQSNMEYTLNNATGGSAAISSANTQLIRQFKVAKGLSDEPVDEVPSGSYWMPATPQYAGNWSAVGFFFANYLYKDLNIPIGIINSSYGGSRIETWMSDEMLGFDEQDVKLANGEPERQPTVAFNRMIHPIVGFPIKGVIWYQAESNGDNMNDALAYGELFIKLINGWRQLWNLGDFPFLWVQLPNFGQVYDQPQTWDAWPQLRAQQSKALSLPNTGEAVAIDVGSLDIHPPKKEPVGYRLSLLARKIAYGEDIVYSGPRYKGNLLRDDGKIEIYFDHIGGGLMAKNSDNGEVYSFAVTSDNTNWVWANAVIDSNKALVWNDDIAEPVKVRYAWEYNPANANLYNKEELPAAPFLADVNPGFKIASFTAGRTTLETGQSTTLSWTVFGASTVTLNGNSVDTVGSITISPAETTVYTLIAINRENPNEADTAVVTVEVLDPDMINRALNHNVTASTYEACCGDELIPEYAVDGDMNTRWSSAWQQESETTVADPNLDDNPDDEWLMVDLGEPIDLERIILYWETAYGSQYDIEVSYDGYLWQTVYEERNGDGNQDNIIFENPVSGRFIKFHFLKRATQWGYSIYEIAAYGKLSQKKPPEAKVTTDFGNVTEPNKKVNITADANDSDGEVVKAEFYADGIPIGTANNAPFKVSWTPEQFGTYNIIVRVTDNDSITVQSEPFEVYVVDNAETTIFEAENGSYTGQGNILSSPATSGGKYLELRDAWTLTFDNIEAPEDGDYLLIMSYQLTFESPKTQYLVVNGDTIAAVEFTAPNKTSWLKRGIYVPLNKGNNVIAIHGFWNWMSFDYIAIKGLIPVSVKDDDVIPGYFIVSQNYPNPFNPVTKIKYELPERSHIKLTVYNSLGEEVAELINKEQTAGSYEIEFDGSGLPSGIYYYTIQSGSYKLTRKMILLK
ncbi:discoidin domain-containing protein [Melioribacter sp. Ez-97]|uniref:discoidin domain-containing protein n=1 Tax=Melioribacter sp. Ez-97 TaxID=3423434 RepID=UPI003EDA69E6